MPKVSVIIPTYNREQFILRALNSVSKQSFTDYEIIVIDDGSKDNTRQLLGPYMDKLKYIYQENAGISAARNQGIQEAKGEYIAFLDSDDIWAPEKLEHQVKVLDTHKKVGIVYVRMPILNEKGVRVGMKPAGASGKNFKELLQIWGDLPTSSVLIRKECFIKVGGFDKTLTISEDTEMWLRISQYWDLYEIEGKELAFYYRHDQQVTKNKIKVYEGGLKTDLKVLDTYKEACSDLIIPRIITTQYMLAKEYYNNGNYTDALGNLFLTLKRRFIIGVYFFNENDRWSTKLLKLLKPYVFLIICSMRLFCSFFYKKSKHALKKNE
jgi:glycosyltransferase involved in cell wall biosynthesis